MSKEPKITEMPINIGSIEQLVHLAVDYRNAQNEYIRVSKDKKQIAMVRVKRTANALDRWLGAYIHTNRPEYNDAVDVADATESEIIDMLVRQIAMFQVGLEEGVEVSGKEFTVTRLDEMTLKIVTPSKQTIIKTNDNPTKTEG